MMMKVVFFFLGLTLALCAHSQQEYEDSFTQWMQSNNKVYAAEEFQTRFEAFKWNMDYVQQWNKNNKDTVLGLNIFADLTNKEYQQIYLGTRINGKERLVKALKTPKLTNVGDNYNATVDWRTKGVVTGVKNQGQCGSCWSFSTTGSVEGVHAQKTGQLVSLSEQNLVDCSQSEGNMGCNGGLMDYAFKYIISNKGIDTEASYPYTAQDGTCQFNPANIGATISSYKDVTSGDETALAAAVNVQPVSVAIDASHPSFQLYTSGIYHDFFCSPTKLDHGVLAVGYGTDTDTKRNYWIVKNSWGTGWGQQGYLYMSKDRNNNCGIATAASVPIA